MCLVRLGAKALARAEPRRGRPVSHTRVGARCRVLGHARQSCLLAGRMCQLQERQCKCARRERHL